MKPHVIHSLSSEIAFGLHDLLRTNAANIHKSDDWFTLFSLLQVVGAAAHPPPVLRTQIKDLSSEKSNQISRSNTINSESDNESVDQQNNPSEKSSSTEIEVSLHR